MITLLQYELPGLGGFCLGGILVIYGLEKGKPWARPATYLFAVLAILQLVMVNSDANPTVPKSFYSYRPPVLSHFTAPPGTYRFISLAATPQSNQMELRGYVNFQSIPEARDLPESAHGEFQTRIQLYTGSMLYRTEGSINLDPERSVPPFIYDVKIYLNRMKSDSVPFNCLLGRLNVKYILRPSPGESAVSHLVADIFNGSPIPSGLYESSCFVPRTYVAGNSIFSMNSDETLNYLASPKFDVARTAILAAAKGSAPAVGGDGAAGEAWTVRREPDLVVLRAQLARPGYVLLLDRFDPNWQATLDGRPVPTVRANQIFRAVYAGPGLHEIRYEYHQRGLRLGAMISLLTLLTLAVLYIRG